MTEAGAKARVTAAEVLVHPDFKRLKRLIIDTTGLHYYEDRDQTIAEKILQHCLQLDCSSRDYMPMALASGADGIFGSLVDDLTIGETYFFRYPEQFDLLRHVVLPERIRHRREKRSLSLWSAGCASGTEAYSLSILLNTHFRTALAGWDTSILGTDINHKALVQAQEAMFSDWELRTTGNDLRQSCFIRSGRGWQLQERFRGNVRFEYQNLATDLASFAQANAGRFDLILCRNVMIYFAPDLMRRMIRQFADCLAPGGWLLVGHAEPFFEIANVLMPEMAYGTTAYCKGEASAALPSRYEPVFPHNDEIPGVSAVPGSPAADFEFAPQVTPSTQPVSSVLPEPPVMPPVRQDDGANAELANIRSLADAGDWPAAAAAVRRGIQRYPLEPAFHFIHALIAEHQGVITDAMSALGRTLYLDHSLALAHYHFGRGHARGGDAHAARKAFENVIRLLDGQADDWHLPLGDGLTAGELRSLVDFQLGHMTGARPDGK